MVVFLLNGAAEDEVDGSALLLFFFDEGEALRVEFLFYGVVGVSLLEGGGELFHFEVVDAVLVGGEVVGVAGFDEADILASVAGGEDEVAACGVAAPAVDGGILAEFAEVKLRTDVGECGGEWLDGDELGFDGGEVRHGENDE